jgi:NADH dehydrogenase FAD-containing subunit
MRMASAQVKKEVEAIRERGGGEVVVVGGGYAGVELATTLADQLPPPSVVRILTLGAHRCDTEELSQT